MTRVFVESSQFSAWIVRREAGAILAEIQALILESPETDALIPGTGGARKLRVGDERRGQGKRGGFRVIYLDLAERQETYLLLIYGKDRKDDLSAEERRQVHALVMTLKGEARPVGGSP
jgi:hypothetical protein